MLSSISRIKSDRFITLVRTDNASARRLTAAEHNVLMLPKHFCRRCAAPAITTGPGASGYGGKPAAPAA
jgi:hypothetical protein